MLGEDTIRLFAENALEMCFAFDKSGKVLYMNKQSKQLLDYQEKEGVTVYDIFPQTFERRDYGKKIYTHRSQPCNSPGWRLQRCKPLFRYGRVAAR